MRADRRHLQCDQPGTVLTPEIEQWLRNEMQREGLARNGAETRFLAARQPSRRFVNDASVTGLIAVLCGPHGPDINGAALPVDGAWTAGR
jgi:3-hydroxybutyrate dehydrogenase